MTPKSDADVWFSVKDVAARLKVSERTIRRWIACGQLRVHRFGRLVRIAKAELEDFERRSRQ